MMPIRHILKNGEVVESIDGHIVKMSDAKSVYALIEKLNERKGEKQ